MAFEIKIPPVGESVASAAVSLWHKKDGDFVKEGEVVAEFDTDKASQELEAGASGILRIQVDEGEEVEVGTVIGLVEEGEAPAETESPGPPADESATAGNASEEANDEDGIRATPVARKMAEEKGVDLRALDGSGAGGRITKADVMAATESGEASGNPELSVVETSSPELVPADRSERVTRRRMSPLRKKIAASLVSAQQNAALLTTFNEVDMSAIMGLRKRVQESFVGRHGHKLGFMSFFVKAVVEGLQAVPSLNGRIDGEEIVENHYFDIGVAVGTDKGLVVPVIRDCERKSFAEIEKDIADYAGKARDGKIQLADLQGGVFTISNGGVYGSMLSTPILNPPQSGILGMHNIQERPMAVDGEVVIRPMMYLALSYDHRLVDGKEAVTFLVRVKECLEDPSRLLVGA